MPIHHLRINHFRNLANVELFPCVNGLNLITGNNGSGKTSLIEAIYYLGHGKSFRASNLNRLIQLQQQKFCIYSQLVRNEQQIGLGVERQGNGATQQRVLDQNVNFSELASLLPIRIINSQSHHLFESGPQYRRKYLDWGLYYQFEGFYACWRKFERALKQRNAVLKEKRSRAELNVWTEELNKYGMEFDAFRREYIQLLAPILSQLAEELLGISDLEIRYLPGWDEALTFEEALNENVNVEYAFGYTQPGPQRADLELRINGLAVKHFLSRGQQKLLICAMIVAQGMLFFKHINKGLVYLIDDLPAELDLQSRTSLLSLLSKQPMQVFITAIEEKMLYESNLSLGNSRVFHVEHGALTEKPRKAVING